MVETILPLVLNGAVVKRRGKRLIGPIDAEISRAGFTIVMGPNGSGKTTLLRLMHGLERLAEGAAVWQGTQIDVQKRQAYVFQNPIMLRRSVKENLAYPLLLRGAPKSTAAQTARDWAARIHLENALEQDATMLSGGEKQKLALARALIQKPDVLFLDEPCSNLDGRATREIEELLLETSRAGTRIVMATHDMGQARRLATEVMFMLHGNLHEFAPAEHFFTQPGTVQARAFLKGDIIE
ncbi:MAG: ATP-binding cassette domain-containing protein [Marinosulfonomonas sp.]|nr:ATP-binding cassette domain-containing protein [Marinosulfonomonas sp.]